ncbi:type VI secretion system secreted protein VgrG [Streptomyces sp. 2112.3]|nr:type VI secretion system secreted protein VgrG [Streptomyces sp. 2112.3]
MSCPRPALVDLSGRADERQAGGGLYLHVIGPGDQKNLERALRQHELSHDHPHPAPRLAPARVAPDAARLDASAAGRRTPESVRTLQGAVGNRAVTAALGRGGQAGTPVQRVGAPPFGKRFSGSSLGTESELSGFVCALPMNASRTFAVVRSAQDDKPLVQVTKDMVQGPYPNPKNLPMANSGQWQIHTVELVTYPSLIDDGQVQERNNAVQFLLEVFRAHTCSHTHEPLRAQTSEDGQYRLEVVGARHVVASGTGMHAEEDASVRMPPAGQQLTMGVAAEDFGTGATREPGHGDELKLLESAPWYRRELAAEAAQRMPGLSAQPGDPASVARVYAYLASVIDFTAGLLAKYRLPMEDYEPEGNPLAFGLTDPKVKNEWHILPRTRPKNMLDTLDGSSRSAAMELLRTMPPRGDEKAWQAAHRYIFRGGGEVAGHGINDAVVTSAKDGRETDHPAALFEFRTVPDQLKRYVPQQRQAEVEISDPLSEFGTRRSEAVRAINTRVAGPGNVESFADWYREQHPRHQDKPVARLLTLATAQQKSQWLRTSRPEQWREIKDRFGPEA